MRATGEPDSLWQRPACGEHVQRSAATAAQKACDTCSRIRQLTADATPGACSSPLFRISLLKLSKTHCSCDSHEWKILQQIRLKPMLLEHCHQVFKYSAFRWSRSRDMAKACDLCFKKKKKKVEESGSSFRRDNRRLDLCVYLSFNGLHTVRVTCMVFLPAQQQVKLHMKSKQHTSK